ncbi:MAG: hypothetical protein LBQ58_06920 [Synergistaceae bacterium]|nr:hypothetical protein [Synergistaceae bacterium]
MGPPVKPGDDGGGQAGGRQRRSSRRTTEEVKPEDDRGGQAGGRQRRSSRGTTGINQRISPFGRPGRCARGTSRYSPPGRLGVLYSSVGHVIELFYSRPVLRRR